MYNKKTLDQCFKNEVLPQIKSQYEQDGIKDIPARCEAYNNYVDGWYKDGLITEKQANKFCIPKNLI